MIDKLNTFISKLNIKYKFLTDYRFLAIYLVLVTISSIFLLIMPEYLNKKPIENNSANKTNNSPQQTPPAEKASEILEISFNFDAFAEQQLSVVKVLKKNGYLAEKQTPEETTHKLVMFQQNDELYSKNFVIPNQINSPPPQPETTDPDPEKPWSEEVIDLSAVNFVIVTPYFDNADKLSVFNDSNEEIFSFRLENLTTQESDTQVETIQGDVLSITTDVLMAGRKVASMIVSDVNAQTTNNFVDIVILSEGYQASEMESYQNTVRAMVNHMFEYEPFKSRRSQLLFHIIENTTELGCSYSGRTIICDNSKVMSVVNSAGIPADVVTVVNNSLTYGGSAFYPYNGNPGIAAVYSGGQWSEEVFVHEIGHAFAILEDEYIANNWGQRGVRNCNSGGTSNTQWQQYTGSNLYISGCNYSSWFRSTDSSIMKALDARYFNPVSIYFINYEIDREAGTVTTPTPTSTPQTSASPTVTGSPSNTPTPRPTTATSGSNPTSTPAPTSTQISTATNTPTPSSAPSNTPTPSVTPAPTTPPNCLQGLTISLESNSHTVSPGDTINNTLVVTNNNDAGCGSTALLGISYAHPSVWTLTPSVPSFTVNAQETKHIPFTVYIKPEAGSGSNIYQLWVASWGPFNGTVTVQ